MAKRRYGLVWWQWALVVLLATTESLGTATSPAGLVGAWIGAAIAFYLLARLFSTASRGVRSRLGRQKQAAES